MYLYCLASSQKLKPGTSLCGSFPKCEQQQQTANRAIHSLNVQAHTIEHLMCLLVPRDVISVRANRAHESFTEFLINI